MENFQIKFQCNQALSQLSDILLRGKDDYRELKNTTHTKQRRTIQTI